MKNEPREWDCFSLCVPGCVVVALPVWIVWGMVILFRVVLGQ